MRKYMNIINRLLFGAVALAALSCTGNFETYNRNPDQPSTIDRDVWDYIKSMQYNVIPTVKNQYQIVENVSGGAYGRYFAYAKSTDAGWNTGMFAFYRIANDWANPPYEVPMTNIYSNWRAIKAELEEPEDDYRMALAQIIRVAAMQRVTDIQGPIPYRTMENNDDLTAPYQSQEAVYGFMLEDLDHAVNVLESAEELREKGLAFSDEAKRELSVLSAAVNDILMRALDAFRQQDMTAARQVEPLEQVIDDLKEQLRTRHILRMQQGQCSIEAGFVWSDLLTDLERTSDHCSNIAGCVIDAAHHDLNMHATLDAARRRDPDFREQYQRCAAKYQV